MPVYNSEKYIKEAISSILKQTYKNFELIIINDGSTDESLNIINEFIEKDSRIILKTIENGGVSNARNVGIELAVGDYIMFVDSDDIVELNFVSDMVKNMDGNDLTICGYSIWTKYEKKNIIVNTPIQNVNELGKMILINNDIGGFCCNKIFKKSLLKEFDIKFDITISICEDLLFVLKYLSKISNFSYIPESLYLYRMRKSSATQNINYDKFITELESYNKMLQLGLSDDINLIIKYRYLKTYYKLCNYFKFIQKTNDDIFAKEKNIIDNITNFKEKIIFYIIKLKLYKFINIFRIKNNKNLFE